jgi:acetolactate synthase-1/2/3 large subunit
MATRISDFVVNKLIDAGVDHFFILVGGNVMYLDDAIRKSGIPYTAFHHEQSAAMAAESYARLHGKLACVVVTSGPGATNVITGVAGAFYDSAPVIFICGNSKSSDLRNQQMPHGVRQVGTFELPIHEVCEPISKFSKMITSISEVGEFLDGAIHEATSNRPGPVVINFPLDLQGVEVRTDEMVFAKKDYSPLNAVGKDSKVFFDELRSALSKSNSPAVLVGHGVRVSGSSDELLELIKKSNIPIFTTQLAKDFIPYEDPLFIGHVGVRGDRPGNVGLHKADVIICVGTSLHQQNIGYEPELFAPDALKFIVEYEGSVSGKNLPIRATFLDIDIRSFVNELEINIKNYKNTSDEWLEYLSSLKSQYASSKEPHDLSTERINLYEFVEILSSSLVGGETIITDAGLCFYIMGQAFKLKYGQRYIVSGGLGAMGYALPAAIGAGVNSESMVIAVTGDGSMQMNVQELATLRLLNRPIKIFVINNDGYASLRNTQKSFFGEDLIGASETSGLAMPNWELIAESYGIEYASIKNSLSIKDNLSVILSTPEVQVIEVFCQADQVVMPGVGNYKDINGRLRSNSLSVMTPKLNEETNKPSLVIN